MSYTHQVPTAIVGLSAARAQALYSMLQRWLVPAMVHKELGDALPLLLSSRPQALLLYASENPTLALQFARRAKAELPDLDIVLLTDRDDLGLAREAVRLKLRGLVVLGTDDEELIALFIRMSEEVYDPVNTGEVICLLGSKGGVGTSSVAINLAGCLAQSGGANVALVDLAPCVGELGVYLDMDTPYSLGRLLREVHLVDQDYIDHTMPRHPWGFYVVSQPLVPDALTPLTHDELLQAARVLQRHFTHVVLDAGGVLSQVSLTAAMVADRSYVIATPGLPALVAARRRLDLLDQRGRDPATTHLLFNRVGLDSSYGPAQAAELTGRPAEITLRNNPTLMAEALHTGRILLEVDAHARLTQEYISLAAKLSGDDAAKLSPEPRRRKLFGLF
ncbi:MAG: hypothetical protein H6741_02945 [Alphaproteobacteria bacterium]|nr:hypothetical protein [Alphaproteobacteria bacterium]